MSRIGILSDAHGNPYGLQLCIDMLHAGGAQSLYFLGDAVGYLPLVEEVLEILRREHCICQSGNHEAMLLGTLPLDPARDSVYRLGDLAQRLAPHERAFLASWPTRRVVMMDGRRLLMLHGGLRQELTEYVYPDSDLSQFGALDTDFVFLGNTHIPFEQEVEGVRVVNVGSCGLPRDGTREACCVLFDSETGKVEFLRTRFDSKQLMQDACQRGTVADAVSRKLIDT